MKLKVTPDITSELTVNKRYLKVAVLKPRLDVTFKKGSVPEERGSIPAIRVHWANFAKNMAKLHIDAGDKTTVIEKPLWQFSSEDCKGYDRVYIPHKEHHNFDVPDGVNAYFYMQTVFPWLFTVDNKGWGAGMGVRVKAKLEPSFGYRELSQWAKMNRSKFDQPKHEDLKCKDYIFFPCQIPHDETIRFHSKKSVGDALSMTAKWCRKVGKTLVVKGHPVNPGSMASLRAIAADYSDVIKWIDKYSVHDLIKNCEAVFCVNSGVGMEALIHLKPVFHFGDAEYSEAAYSVEDGDIQRAWDGPRHSEYHLKSWLETWVNFCYDTRS